MPKDTFANAVLRELREDIVNLVDVDQVANLFVLWKRIHSSELDKLQSTYSHIDQKRKEHLYDTALVGKGRKGLEALLKALDETAHRYHPHAVLAEKLRKAYRILKQPELSSRRSSKVFRTLLTSYIITYIHV